MEQILNSFYFWLVLTVVFVIISIYSIRLALRGFNDILRNQIEPLYKKWLEVKGQNGVCKLVVVRLENNKPRSLPRLKTAICLPAPKNFTQSAILTGHKSKYQLLVLTRKTVDDTLDIFAMRDTSDPYWQMIQNCWTRRTVLRKFKKSLIKDLAV